MAVLSATDKNFTSTMEGALSAMEKLEEASDRTRNSILKIDETVTVLKAVGFAANDLAAAFGGVNIALLTGDLEMATEKLLALNNAFLVSGSAAEGIGIAMQKIQNEIVTAVITINEATDKILADNGFLKLAGIIDNAKLSIVVSTSDIVSGIGAVSKAVSALDPAIKSSATAWDKYKAALEIVKTINTVIESITEAQKIIKTLSSVTKLLTAATADNEKATKAKAAADELATIASVAKTAAAKEGYRNSVLNVQAQLAETAAISAKANADNLAAIAAIRNAEAKGAIAIASTTATAATLVETQAEIAGAAAITAGGAAVAVKTALLAGLSGVLGIATTAQMAFSAAVAAHPIGAAVVLITALVGVIGVLGNALNNTGSKYDQLKSTQEEFAESAEETLSTIKDSIKAYEDEIDSITSTAGANKQLVQEIKELCAVENKSSGQKALLQSKINSLNSSVEGLNLAYNEETNSLNIGNDVLDARVHAYGKMAEAQTAEERRVALLADLDAAERTLAEATQARIDIDKQMSDVILKGGETINGYSELLQDAKEKEDEARETKAQLLAQQEELDNAIMQGAEAQANAVNQGTAAQIASWEDLSEAQTSVIEELGATFNSYADAATNMFDRINTESEHSIDDMIENLEHNRDATANWATNMATLAKEGIDDGLLEQLRTAGPESAGLVQTLVDGMEDGKLDTLSDLFGQNTQLAMEAMNVVLNTSNVPEGAMGLIERTSESMQESINSAFPELGNSASEQVGAGMSENVSAILGSIGTIHSSAVTAFEAGAAEYTSVGTDAAAGYASGLESGTGSITDAASSGILAGIEAARAAQNSNSPSVVYKGLGTDAIAGYMLGVTGSQGALSTTMTAAMQVAVNAAKTAITTGLRSVVSTAGVIFNLLGPLTSIGMASMNAAISVGMSAANSKVASGTNSMVAKVRTLQSSFYSSGVYASQGLANGINARAGAAISAAQIVANRVAAIMARALQERSPSRRTKKIGAYASEGLAIGILDELSLVERASRLVASAAADLMVPDMGNISGRLVYAGDISYGRDDDMLNYTANHTYTFVIPIQADGREFAKASATFTQEELTKMERINSRRNGIRN